MPRLIEATGERIVPWARDAQVVYEHYHRYLWTRPLVAGRRVLDLGSGEGYGSALLAQTASTVTGIDIDERAVAHSAANYPDVAFRVASGTDLSAFADDSFDAVVAFYSLTHVPRDLVPPLLTRIRCRTRRPPLAWIPCRRRSRTRTTTWST